MLQSLMNSIDKKVSNFFTGSNAVAQNKLVAKIIIFRKYDNYLFIFVHAALIVITILHLQTENKVCRS